MEANCSRRTYIADVSATKPRSILQMLLQGYHLRNITVRMWDGCQWVLPIQAARRYADAIVTQLGAMLTRGHKLSSELASVASCRVPSADGSEWQNQVIFDVKEPPSDLSAITGNCGLR